jgi:prepilin-type N-terminal cleavage/methylation domain-containing protein
MGGFKLSTRRAFTLIELLVVIAIIAILAAILFPVFMSAKQKARTMKCLAHGRELGHAMAMYWSDNNDRFPCEIWDENTINRLNLGKYTWEYSWGAGTSWHRTTWNGAGQFFQRYQMRPYVKSEEIWICPDPNTLYAKRYAYGFRQSWNVRSSDGWNGSKYEGFVNGDRGFMGVAPHPLDPKKTIGVGRTIQEVQALDRKGETTCGARHMPPTRKIVFMCYALGRWAQGGRVGDGNWPWVFPSYAHHDGSVFVYADGHAAWHKMGQGWAPLGYSKLDIDQRQ